MNTYLNNYQDDKIVTIVKHTNEKIIPSHELKFIKYNLRKNFNNLNNIYFHYNYFPKYNFYSFFTIKENSVNKTIQFYIRGFEFEEISNKDSNDIFIYEIDNKYFFALYIDKKIAYISNIFIKSNFINLFVDLKELIYAIFNISVDNIYIVNIITETNINLPNTFYIKHKMVLKEIEFKSLENKLNSFQFYIFYLIVLLISFALFLNNKQHKQQDKKIKK